MTCATAFAPATVGNLGPGFDVLGACVEGLGDTITVELLAPDSQDLCTVAGRDAQELPTHPQRNAAVISARAVLSHLGVQHSVQVHANKGLPMSGGMGGSAASSVGGALATFGALGIVPSARDLMACALVGETAVAGPHLDNIAPCVLGGVTLVLNAAALDVVTLGVVLPLHFALVTPALRVETQAARALLPSQSPRAEWIQQMANTAALVAALLGGDAALLGRAMNDVFAEPRRASLVKHFYSVKAAALGVGALGCSLSGSGPTVFALASTDKLARDCAQHMQAAFEDIPSTAHVGALASTGARLQ